MDVVTIRWVLHIAGMRFAGVTGDGDLTAVHAEDGTVVSFSRDGTVIVAGRSKQSMLLALASVLEGATAA